MGGITEPLLAGAAPGPSAVPSASAVAARILRASSVYGLANLGIRALNFLLLPIYTRFLTPADYGVIVLAETLAAFLLSILSLGFDASIQRLYFRHVDDSKCAFGLCRQRAEIRSGSWKSVSSYWRLPSGPRLQHTLAPTAAVPFRYMAMALATAVATQFFSYRLVLYQAERRPWSYAILSLFSFGLTASLTIALVVFARRGVTGMLGGKLIAAAVCLLIAVFLARHAFALPLPLGIRARNRGRGFAAGSPPTHGPWVWSLRTGLFWRTIAIYAKSGYMPLPTP